jgi:hypothetical protein
LEPISTALAVKAGTELTDVAKESSKSFLTAVLREPGEALGGLLGDKIRERRHSNLIKITARAQERLKAAGVTPKEIPLSIIHPALEAASLEEDPDLQEMWANLLASTAGPRTEEDGVAPSFATILKELRARDVKFLNALFMEAWGCRGRQPGVNEVEDVKFYKEQLYIVYSKVGLSRFVLGGTPSSKDWENKDFMADVSNVILSVDTFERNRVFVEV